MESTKEVKVELFQLVKSGEGGELQVLLKVVSTSQKSFIISNIEQNDAMKVEMASESSANYQLFSDKIRNGRNISVPEISEVCSESGFECYIDGLPAHEVYPEDFEEPTPP